MLRSKKNMQSWDLVLKKNKVSRQEHIEKLSPNWKAQYRVVENRSNSSYVLENIKGVQLSRTWNMRNLRKFHF